MSDSNRERDLVLAPNEYAFISDQTKGNINVYVGPYKTSLANTDKPVAFDDQSKRFLRCSLDESTQTFTVAPEGWYIILKNPPKHGDQPKNGTNNSLAELNVGRKINIPGPKHFALWPGQMVRVVRGHHLRSNQYLVVRVYDEEEARQNWGKAVIKTKNEEKNDQPLTAEEIPDLTMGKTLIIKGDAVSFYIPPTGVEVVRETNGEYVREAVTLERLEYCILLEEDGNKRFIQGPAVVFPKPTEEFVQRNGSRKFLSIELNEMSGLYIKVIAPYTEDGKTYKEGDELFITGKEQMIYYPRPEHAIIKYGKREKHFAVAIPDGEGRYYLNRKTGKVALQRGPAMFLPDPRAFVLVRRILEEKQVQLWFPGNEEALRYNKALQQIAKSPQEKYVAAQEVDQSPKMAVGAAPMPEVRKREKPSKEVASEEFERGESYTPPRTVTLDNKYDGAVTINVWTGYAILVVSKTGKRKVITGPHTYLLEYDETLEAMTLSTGTPKTEENPLRTVYLRVLHNRISDVILAESSDFTQVSLTLSYRVNFEGEAEKWFNVENFVKFLTDHLRSFVRNVVKKHTIMDFYAKGVDILRDAILGVSEGGKRPGRLFEENGMRIYDVEVLNVHLTDKSIEQLLISAQQEVVKQTLRIEAEKRKLEFTQSSEQIAQQIAKTESETKQNAFGLQIQEAQKELELTLAQLQKVIQEEEAQLQARLAQQQSLNAITTAEIERQRQREAQTLETQQAQLQQQLTLLKGEVEATVSKAQAISPDLIAAMQAFSDKALAQKMADSMAPLAILGGRSVADVFAQLLKGSGIEHVLQQNP
ncbi:MAG: hypothetical protein ACFCUI_08505 [Bernardetiaceae bacterium]